MSVGEGKVDAAWSMGTCAGETSIDAWDVEEGKD